MNKYIVGDVITDNFTFTSIEGVPADPASVSVKYNVSYAQTVSATIVLTYGGASTPGTGIVSRDSTGAYEVNFDTTLLPGYWWWQWTGNTPGQDVNLMSAIVYPTIQLIPIGRTFGTGLIGSGTFGGN